MIRFEFSRRPDQGAPSGFDLGDMSVSGDSGAATSKGRAPDQGMMIFLSLSLLLDQLRALVQLSNKSLEFVGADSSFSLWFKPRRGAVEVSSLGGVIGVATVEDLFGEILRAVDEFTSDELEKLSDDDAGRLDLVRSIRRFREVAPQR